MTLECWDCYLAREQVLYACPKHATPEQRAEADRRVRELANMKHPLLGNMPEPERQHIRYTIPIVNATFKIPKDDE